jgi:predicted DNA-binding protein
VPKIRFQIYLDGKQIDKLKIISSRTAAPIAAIVRMAIDDYLKKIKNGKRG